MTADLGLFGPESVTWRIHADPMLWVGGVRALLLQALHPVAMRGIADHSRFRADPWGRLMRTADYVGVTTYGTTKQAREAGERVRRIHDHVRGPGYRANDPELLRWVHCCEVDSFLTVYRMAGGGVTAEQADAYVAEQTRLAPLVGLDEARVPASVAELSAYFEAVRPELRATGEARRTALFALAPPMPRWVEWATPARGAWAGMTTLAFASLPTWGRRLYGLPGLAVTSVPTTVALRTVRTALRAVPEHLRRGPHYRAALARCAAAGIALSGS